MRNVTWGRTMFLTCMLTTVSAAAAVEPWKGRVGITACKPTCACRYCSAAVIGMQQDMLIYFAFVHKAGFNTQYGSTSSTSLFVGSARLVHHLSKIAICVSKVQTLPACTCTAFWSTAVSLCASRSCRASVKASVVPSPADCLYCACRQTSSNMTCGLGYEICSTEYLHMHFGQQKKHHETIAHAARPQILWHIFEH